jgi:alpha-L-fucosidase
MLNSWSHVTDAQYRTATSILHDLIDIVSKNGTLLLNVGPHADGSIPDQDAAILTDIGRWLELNGEALYGTRPFKVYGEGPTHIVAGGFQDMTRVPFTARDVRFTTKGDTLYAIALGKPEDGKIVVESLGLGRDVYPKEIVSVQVLGTDSAVEWSHGHDGLQVMLPPDTPDQVAYTVKIS